MVVKSSTCGECLTNHNYVPNSGLMIVISHETLKVIDRQVALDARHHLVTILIAAIDLHHAEIVHHLSETSILQEVVLHRKGLEVVLQDAVQGARLSPSEAVGATEDELDHLEASHHAERVVLAHLWEQEGTPGRPPHLDPGRLCLKREAMMQT